MAMSELRKTNKKTHIIHFILISVFFLALYGFDPSNWVFCVMFEVVLFAILLMSYVYIDDCIIIEEKKKKKFKYSGRRVK